MEIPATHLLHGKYPVIVLDDKIAAATVQYVGPIVPDNRKIGQVVLATKGGIFSGKPALTVIK